MNKKQKHPVVMEKPRYVQWPGYSGDMEWGELFMLQWPVEHPDSHCENHSYVPDNKGLCGCGWVPADKICCKGCNELLRFKIEKQILHDMIEESPFSVNPTSFAVYHGYCDEFREKLNGTPDLMAVFKRFAHLKSSKQHEIVRKYSPKSSVVIRIKSLEDLSAMFNDIYDDLLEILPQEIIDAMINDMEIPENVRKAMKTHVDRKNKL